MTECNKVDARVECLAHEYPYCEALYPDNWDTPLPCDINKEALDIHINQIIKVWEEK